MKRLLAPRSIAVVGASANPTAIGGQPIRQLLRHGFTGEIYPVNPKREEVQGLRCYPSVVDLPEGIDMAIVAVAARHVNGIVELCGARGIPYVAVLSSGFADAGGEGVRLQEELVATARRHGVRLIGPNSVGYVSMGEQVYAGFGAFFEYEFAAGTVSFVTQSGGVGGSLLTVLDEEGVGFRHFVHTGNAADLDIESMLDAFIDDDGTHVLLAYIEGLAENSAFGRVAQRALSAGKPLVAWKAGKSSASGSAVVSHTGRLAGDIDRYRALFERYGVIEVDDSSDLGDVLRLTQVGCVPLGRRVGVVSVSGGAGVIAADCLDVAKHIDLAEFSTQTEQAIADLLPSFATSRNPIDVTAQIFNEPDLFEKVVSALCQQDEVDVIVACVASVHGPVGERIAQAIVETQAAVDVPIAAVWASRDELNSAAFKVLESARIPLFRAPERALRALDRVAVLGRARTRDAGELEHGGPSTAVRVDSWERTTEVEVLEVLSSYGICTPKQRLVHSAAEAVEALREIGGPVVMKIQSPDVAHKAKIGGVHLGVADEGAAAAAYAELVDAAGAVDGAELRGIAVQQMVDPGVEVICGYLHDDVLGDFLLCGGGGSGVETVHDTQLIPMPATREDLRNAVAATRVASRLSAEPGTVAAVADVLWTLQRVVSDNTGRIGELEVNPVIVTANGAVAVDALAVHRSTR